MVLSNARVYRVALLSTTALALAIAAPAAQAQETTKPAQIAPADRTRNFAIPAGALDDALAAFGAQSGMAVSMNAGALQGALSPGATGNMTPQQALSRMLAGTQYTYAVSGNTATILNQAQASGGARLDQEQVTVTGEAYREELSSPKYTASLLDTPQSVTVVPKQVMQDENLLGLTQILSTLPGITFGAGEAAGGFGDNININGFTATNNIFVDGMRDSAQYSRTDSYDLESLELINGADSAIGGVGGVGGAVNMVTKVARPGDFNLASLGVGTDNYYRATADINHEIDSETAVRLNAVIHENDVPGRDVENFKRWGFAPSIIFGLGTSTRFSLSYSHQHDDNIPQYGVPTFNGRILPGASWSAYYGFRNLDTQKIDSDFVQAVFDHDFSSNLTVHNQTRFENISQLSIVDPPAGTYCLSDGLAPVNGGGGTYGKCSASVPPGYYLRSTGNVPGHLRDATNQMIANETDANWKFDTGFVEHNAVIGASFSHETLRLRDGAIERSADGTWYQNPPTSIANPDTTYAGPVNFIISNQAGYTQAQLDDGAVYAFDTMKFTDQWLFNVGVRYDRVNGFSQIDNASLSSTGAYLGTVHNPQFSNNNGLFSYRFGLLYKPLPNGTIYFSYGSSTTPSMTSVDGSCTAATCSSAPEKAATFELGTKWELLNNKLLLSGSVFRDDRSNYLVADAGDPDNPSGVSQVDGSSRVDGVSVGATGKITDKWSIFANYSLLSSQVIQGVSNYQETQGLDYTRGDPLTNVPKHSGSLWTTYDITRALEVGYGITEMGKVYVVQHSATYTTGPLPTSSGYTVSQAMARYLITDNLGLQLNVTNLFDKHYLTHFGPQNLRWAVPGDGRRAVLSLNASF